MGLGIKVMIIFLIFFSGPACAAEALFPIKVTLIRCVTQAERVNMCDTRQMCCDLVAPDNMVVVSSIQSQHDNRIEVPKEKATYTVLE